MMGIDDVSEQLVRTLEARCSLNHIESEMTRMFLVDYVVIRICSQKVRDCFLVFSLQKSLWSWGSILTVLAVFHLVFWSGTFTNGI